MPNQTPQSPHLATARRLLDDIAAAEDPQVKATAAAAHAGLVLAEQIAGVRLVIAAQAAGEPPQAAKRRLVSRARSRAQSIAAGMSSTG